MILVDRGKCTLWTTLVTTRSSLGATWKSRAWSAAGERKPRISEDTIGYSGAIRVIHRYEGGYERVLRDFICAMQISRRRE